MLMLIPKVCKVFYAGDNTDIEYGRPLHSLFQTLSPISFVAVAGLDSPLVKVPLNTSWGALVI